MEINMHDLDQDESESPHQLHSLLRRKKLIDLDYTTAPHWQAMNKSSLLLVLKYQLCVADVPFVP